MTTEIFVTEVVIQLGLVALAAVIMLSQAIIIETKDKESVINPLSILYTSVLALGLFETLFYAVVR